MIFCQMMDSSALTENIFGDVVKNLLFISWRSFFGLLTFILIPVLYFRIFGSGLALSDRGSTSYACPPCWAMIILLGDNAWCRCIIDDDLQLLEWELSLSLSLHSAGLPDVAHLPERCHR